MRQAGPRVTRPKAARQVWSRASESSPRRSHAAELATASAAEGSSGSGHADDRLVAIAITEKDPCVTGSDRLRTGCAQIVSSGFVSADAADRPLTPSDIGSACAGGSPRHLAAPGYRVGGGDCSLCDLLQLRRRP